VSIGLAIFECAVLAVAIRLTHRKPSPSADELVGDETAQRMREHQRQHARVRARQALFERGKT
jgi:hypothetical protein